MKTGGVLALVGLWLMARLAGPWAGGVGLVIGVAVGLVAAIFVARRPPTRGRLHLSPLAVAGTSGAVLALLAIGAGWWLGGDGGGNWALRHGLALGWWTDRMPFLPGKLLAVLVGAAVVATIVIPDELVTRGLALQASRQRGWAFGAQLGVQVGLTVAAGLGVMWHWAPPPVVVVVHIATLAALATTATVAARTTDGLLAPVVVHAAFRCVLIVHAFAWIPRLYR